MNSLQLKIEDKAKVLLTAFLASKSNNTKSAYQVDIQSFAMYVKHFHNINSIQEIIWLPFGDLNYIVLNYKDYLLAKNLSAATVNRRLGALRSLIKLARLTGLTSNRVEISNVKSESYRDTKGPGLAAFKRMINFATNQSSLIKARRDHAILRLLFDLALRASELVELDISHVDLKQKRISIKGKGRLQRQFLSLPNTSINAISQWLEVRGKNNGPLFSNMSRALRPKRLTRIGLYKLIRWIGKNADIKTRPHGVRHLSITEACKAAQNNGFALEEVMDHSRHKSVATLMIYRDRERNVQGAISTLVANTILEET